MVLFMCQVWASPTVLCMANPLLALLGLGVGALGSGAVLLGGAVGSLSLGPLAPSAPGAATSLGPRGVPAVSPAEQAADEAVAASCPGLDWTLLAGGVLIDPALAAGLASAASALCQSPNVDGTLTTLLGGPIEAQVALVLAHALDANPDLDAPVAVAITFAASNLGAPYRWGGTGPSGFDCSGLTLKAYAAAGITIPRVAQAQFDAGPTLPADAVPEPGDLVFFGSGPTDVSHVGLYLGGGDMIDAPHTGATVRIEPTPTSVGARFGGDLYVGATRPG
jgi:cell wall-associated NlpC family hydrolase